MDTEVIKDVYENLSALGSGLPESFCGMAVRRLNSVKLTVDGGDDCWNLAFAARKAEVEILDYCHIELVPSTLFPVLCDRVCGRYLYDLKQSGRLEMEGLDLSGILTSISEGDVSLSFDAAASDESRLDALLGLMMASGREGLACYRRIRF